MAARSTGHVGKYEIEKFNGKNDFNFWRSQMRDVLISQKLHKVLKGRPTRPEGMSDEDWDAKRADQMSDEDWEELDLQACAAIRLCLDRDVVVSVNEETTAAGIWQKLEAQYMTKNLTNRLYMKKSLFRMTMDPGSSIRDHITKFTRIVSNLRDVDVKIDDEDQALTLLFSLPDEYENLVQTMLCGKESITMDEATSALLTNEIRKLACGDGRGDSQPQGLMARGRSEGRGSSKNRGRSRSRGKKETGGVQCYNCKRFGHIAAECSEPLKKPWKAKGRQEPKEKAKVNNEASCVTTSGDEHSDCFSASASSNYYDDRWVMDSSCTFHMCPRREWFSSYRAIDGEVVLMGNNHGCRAEGIGSIEIKTHDGVVRTLTNVRHVPDLKKNLLSLGVLATNGCKFCGRGRSVVGYTWVSSSYEGTDECKPLYTHRKRGLRRCYGEHLQK